MTILWKRSLGCLLEVYWQFLAIAANIFFQTSMPYCGNKRYISIAYSLGAHWQILTMEDNNGIFAETIATSTLATPWKNIGHHQHVYLLEAYWQILAMVDNNDYRVNVIRSHWFYIGTIFYIGAMQVVFGRGCQQCRVSSNTAILL